MCLPFAPTTSTTSSSSSSANTPSPTPTLRASSPSLAEPTSCLAAAPLAATGSRSPHVGPPADVYALGAMLYELLTGRPPFRAATVLETLEQVKNAEAVPPGKLQPGLARDLDTICLKCLQKDPRRRYRDIGDVSLEIDDVSGKALTTEGDGERSVAR